MNCKNCGQLIPSERILALPNTTTCVKCSTDAKLIGITIWDKTTPYLEMVDEDKAARLIELSKFDGAGCRY